MKTEHYIFYRHTINGWNAVRINIKPEDYETVYNELVGQDPKPKLKIVRVTEEIIVEDK